MILIAFASSSMGIFNAGRSRTFCFAVMTRTPRSRHFVTTSAAGFSVSMPIMKPRPDTLFTPDASFRASKIYAAFSVTSLIHSSVSLENTLMAPAQQTGLPPKVEPWLPGIKISFTFSPSMVAPRGSPPPRPLAVLTISGVISKCI